MSVRTAEPDEFMTIIRILDSALLETNPPHIRDHITENNVLVYVQNNRILGTAVLDGSCLDLLAVRPKHRQQGIGEALVDDAFEQVDVLEAEFDSNLRSFYANVGFEITRRDNTDRFVGIRKNDSD